MQDNTDNLPVVVYPIKFSEIYQTRSAHEAMLMLATNEWAVFRIHSAGKDSYNYLLGKISIHTPHEE